RGILVKRGTIIEEGALIGFHSAETQQQIGELQAKLQEEQDELIRAEIEAEIAELREGNEVRALVSGWVKALWVEQVEEELAVHLRVVLPPQAQEEGGDSRGGRSGCGKNLESS
ncbi:MAG: hypothetical protein ACE5KR_04850, partial [Candidatus Bipolaricaulia bacterium]